MLSSEERYELVLDALQRLEPEIRRKNGRRTVEFRHIPPSDEEDLRPMPVVMGSPNSNLESMLRHLGPLPRFTAIFGQCSDGLPLLFDLNDPTPGSILINGDIGSGKTRLLQTILSSASYLNRSHEVVFSIITPNPGEFESFRRIRHCHNILPSYDRRSFEWLVDLCEIGEQRRSGRGDRVKIIQIIDDLKAFLQTKEQEVSPYLRWLVQFGPLLGIWMIASVETNQLRKIQTETLSLFGTVLTGNYQAVYDHHQTALSRRQPGLPNEFTYVNGAQEIRFWVPAVT